MQSILLQYDIAVHCGRITRHGACGLVQPLLLYFVFQVTLKGRSFFMASIRFNLNGKPQNADVIPEMPLLWYLRDSLGMTGTKFGCGMALCGACTVHVDGQAVRSCVTPVSSLAGKSVTTIEGLSADGTHPVQVAWTEVDVPQCGYCQSGQIM